MVYNYNAHSWNVEVKVIIKLCNYCQLSCQSCIQLSSIIINVNTHTDYWFHQNQIIDFEHQNQYKSKSNIKWNPKIDFVSIASHYMCQTVAWIWMVKVNKTYKAMMQQFE